MSSAMVFARVYPPRPLQPEALEALLLRLASDPTSAAVVLEARAIRTESGESTISYWLGSSGEHLRWLRRTAHDLLPGLLVDTEATGRFRVNHAARLDLHPPGLALAADRPEHVATAILSALNQQLLPDESLALQLLFGPRRTPQHRRRNLIDPGQPWWSVIAHGTNDAPTTLVKQHDQRILQAGIATCVRIGVATDDRAHPDRYQRLLTGLLGGLSTAKAPGTFMRLRREQPTRLDNAHLPRGWRTAPAVAELVGLTAWPLGDADLPGLPPMHPKLLPPSQAIRAGNDASRILGMSGVPGSNDPIPLSAKDSLFHLVATGPTGSGKSTALLHLIRADIHAGRPVLVIDPKRQLIDDVLERAIPEERIDDVVILDLDPRANLVPGFNPLDVGTGSRGRDPDVVVDGLLAVFAAVFADGWGPRTQDITHSGLLSLARSNQRRAAAGADPHTLLDLPRLFVDATFRRSVIGHDAHDPGLATFWAWYNSLTPQAQAAALAAPANKWRQYLLRPSIRRVLGQPSPRFRIRDLFRQQKIVLAPLNESLIGPITAQLVGGLLVAEAWAATLERAAETNPALRPGSIWIDEAQNYTHLPTSLDDALAASRSLGVSWNLAHQFRSQWPASMAAAVDSNARNKLVFAATDPKDAAAFARFVPQLEPTDFLTLPSFTAYATVMHSGAQQPWCTVRTLPPPAPSGLAAEIRRTSINNYGGSPPAPPESHAAATADSPGLDAPVGRKPRPRPSS
ncbi:MAG: hypothetical protein NTX33_00105 [Propionibacteriales bacterium]|nr:hypothetical protein [Propionibacteriales bacterium]